MKHFIVFIFVLFTGIVTSCNASLSNEDLSTKNSRNESLYTRSGIQDKGDDFFVSIEMAECFAKSFKESPTLVSIEPYVFKGITCFYIVNYEKGWIAIPADSRVQPIIAEDETNNLYLKELDNPGFESWLNMTAEYIASAKKYGIKEYDNNNVKLWDRIRQMSKKEPLKGLRDDDDQLWVRITTFSTYQQTIANIQHLLQTKWGQKAPWNCSLPLDPYPSDTTNTRLITGCVPTAIAQVLYYFHNSLALPNDFWHSIVPYISQTINGTPNKYKLSLIKNNYQTYSDRWDYMPTLNTAPDYFDYVSDLMLDIGVRIGATYSVSLTTASLLAQGTLESCGLSYNPSHIYSYSIVKSNLLNYKPVFISATDSLARSHAWVIDGCFDQLLTERWETFYYVYQPGVIYPDNTELITESEVLSMYPNAYNGMSIVDTNTTQVQYLLMNYGWNGNHDDGHYSVLYSCDNWANGFNSSPRIVYDLIPGQMY